MDQRDVQALQAAKLYYRHNMSQGEVAGEMGISRPTVAKLLQHAKTMGYVTTVVHDPREHGDELAQELKERFHLTDVRLVFTPRNDRPTLLDSLGRTGAQLLWELVEDDMSVGISWGNTMSALARHLRHKDVRGVSIVQLKGGHSHSTSTTNDMDTLKLLCTAFDAEPDSLPLPVIFDSAETKRIVEQDRHIAGILERGRNTDLAVFTVGGLSPDGLLMNLGYLSDFERATLLDRAVGDVCSRFYTAAGEIALPQVDERTVGISIEELAARPQRLLVAGGIYKARSIATALGMGLATHLVIDKETASRLLALTD